MTAILGLGANRGTSARGARRRVDYRVFVDWRCTAGMWTHGDAIQGVTYKKLRTTADEYDLEVDVPELASR